MKRFSYAMFFFWVFIFNAYAGSDYVPPEGYQDYLTPNIRLTPLAPKHVGLTSTPVPMLYFYTAIPEKEIEVTITKPTVAEPLLKTTLKAPSEKGIYGFSLADYNVILKKNTEYEWILRIRNDLKQPSADVVGTGAIKFVPLTEKLSEQVGTVKGEALHKFYAENGYWYDAVDCVSIMVNRESAKKE